MKIVKVVRCPYCLEDGKHEISVYKLGMLHEVLTCNHEDGCGKEFAIRADLILDVTAGKIIYDGEEKGHE